MRLIFRHSYKSITALDEIEAPDFLVLTGLNGAGKSHLLEAIESGAVVVDGMPSNPPQGPQHIRRFDSASLVPRDTGPFSSAQISQEQASLWNEIDQHKKQYLEQLTGALRQYSAQGLDSISPKKLIALSQQDLIARGLTQLEADQVLLLIANSIQAADQNIANLFLRNDPQNRPKLLSSITGNGRSSLFAMEVEDFFREYPKLWQPVDLFQQSFARLFAAYNRQWSLNKLRAAARADGEDVSFLTEADFVAKHGTPPWDVLNDLLAAAELDFRINQPHKYDDLPYEPVLTDINRGVKVKFNDLSSGERILMSFALCLYHANDPTSTADFPKLILFDEVDSPLHPSMTRSLLRTIDRTLVEQHAVKVILTTHSPSTVALAPVNSIFVMRKEGPRRLHATSRDAALGILTAGVPALSVSYDNRRQVFVESKHDANCYGRILEIVKASLDPEISISFIAAGTNGSSSCEQVKSLVDQLRNGGNKTVFGVVDWDRRNASADSVLVLGSAERYSIENFVLDPLGVALLLLRERWACPLELGLVEQRRYLDALTMTPAELQALADAIVRGVSSTKALSVSGQDEVVVFRYEGGQQVSVPQWFAHLQGHALEQHLKEAFPPLRRHTADPELMLAVIRSVFDDFPSFVPIAFTQVFRRIQGAGADEV